MSNVKTIILTGEETEIDFEQNFMCFWVQNLGSGTVYASDKAGIVPDSDGTISIPAGSSARVSAPSLTQIDKLWISGSGKVQIVGTYSVHCPFKVAPKGGGGGGGISTYAELPDKPGINGKLLPPGYTSFEDLGWYELTEKDVVNIVDKAFDEVFIKNNNIIVEIPFNKAIDGYGYTLYTITGNYVINEDGFHVLSGTGATCVNIFSIQDIQDLDAIKISFDCKLGPNLYGTNWDLIVRFVFTLNGVEACINVTCVYTGSNSYKYYFSNWQASNPNAMPNIGDIGQVDNQWHHIDFTFRKNTVGNSTIDFQLDDNEIKTINVSNSIVEIHDAIFNGNFVIGTNGRPYNEYCVKNLIIEIPEEG